MNTIGRAIIAFFLVLLCCEMVSGEEHFQRPYFARDDRRFKTPRCELAEAIDASDLVFIGTSNNIDTTNYSDISGEGYYEASIYVGNVLKGAATSPVLRLSWRPSATNIKENTRHVFFVKAAPERLSVLKEIYVFSDLPWCRTYRYLDGGLESTLGVIDLLLHPGAEISANLPSALRADLAHKDQRQRTAIRLMCEVPRRNFVPALVHAIENDADDYLMAVYALCRIDGNIGASTASQFLTSHPKLESWKQAAVFDAIVAAGNVASVEALQRLGDRDLRFRVSCAFAIRDIAPERRRVVEPWIVDSLRFGLQETLCVYDTPLTWAMSDLLKAAIDGKQKLEYLELK